MNIGTKNNNWLNIRYNENNKWKGQVGSDKGFCVFSTPAYGIRAGRIIILKYIREGFDTLGEIIARWAPPVENMTTTYIDNVSAWTGFDRHDKLTADDLNQLLVAMVREETGNHVTDGQLKETST